jgi:hypothetical protein
MSTDFLLELTLLASSRNIPVPHTQFAKYDRSCQSKDTKSYTGSIASARESFPVVQSSSPGLLIMSSILLGLTAPTPGAHRLGNA